MSLNISSLILLALVLTIFTVEGSYICWVKVILNRAITGIIVFVSGDRFSQLCISGIVARLCKKKEKLRTWKESILLCT